MDLMEMGVKAREAAFQLGRLSQTKKDECLLASAEALISHAGEIISRNSIDIASAREKGTPEPLIDRLTLDEKRIEQMADGLRQVASLKDPVGEILYSAVRPNGLEICQKRVPIGVIGIIYESRPNVTADSFGLCFKTGNAVILRGGSDAIHSNTIIVNVLRETLAACGCPEDAVQIVTDTGHESARQMMKMTGYIDVLIPRGGAGLIRSVVENSTVPVIETGTGNCHVFVDASADTDMAVEIILNAKTQRTGVCNACESIVIHEAAAERTLPAIAAALRAKGCELRGDDASRDIFPDMKEASEEDWGTEYLDLIASVRIVKSLDEAITHINKYHTGHSDAIVTRDYANARRFLDEIDSAAVYVNASTRFTDGNEFGFGAEIGISTQKLHARGPMGLKELTTTKYVVYGNGQIRK